MQKYICKETVGIKIRPEMFANTQKEYCGTNKFMRNLEHFFLLRNSAFTTRAVDCTIYRSL